MSNFPDDLKYAESHEWLRVDEQGVATVGISDHAQRALGDIVFVELPDVGTSVEAGAQVAVVESVKAASDVYSPVSGEITEVNQALLDSPEKVNAAPYGDGWFFRVKLAQPKEAKGLLDATAYAGHCKDE